MTPSSFRGDSGPKRASSGARLVDARALAAHAGIDFEVNGKRTGAQPGGVRGGFKIVDLRGFPDDRVSRCWTTASPWPGKTPAMTMMRASGHSARAATPSSTLVTPIQRAPARTTAGAQRASEWP